MRKLAAGVLVAAIVAVVVVGLTSTAVVVVRSPERALPPPVLRDLDAILARDTLVALTSYNATSYFLYRGQPFGYEYELLKAFAEETGITFYMRVVPRDSLLPMLNRGVGDIVAARIIPSDRDTAHFNYTAELYQTRPALVQLEAPPEEARGAEGTRATPSDEAVLPTSVDTALASAPSEPPPLPLQIAARFVRRLRDLDGREVHLPSNSAYVERLVELEDAISGDIEVVEVDTTSESLIRDVARAEIAYTVAEENVALLEESFYTNLSVAPTVGPTHGVTWAVRGNAPVLLRALDDWIGANRDGPLFAELYQRYYVDRQRYRERVASRYLTGSTRVLSDYDALFRRAADSLGWDWRLFASQAYQESEFVPTAQSWAGAAGLLQLMPATARAYGVADPYKPEDNVAGAVRFIRWLEDYWDGIIADPDERLKFVLASYNTGHGHVEDARLLAAKNGDDDTKWEDVAYWLLQKAKAEVYTDPVVRHGFCRGLEPVQYVARILDRYEHYRQFVPAGPV